MARCALGRGCARRRDRAADLNKIEVRAVISGDSAIISRKQRHGNDDAIRRLLKDLASGDALERSRIIGDEEFDGRRPCRANARDDLVDA
jgi:hypothetical protein